jgi:hypothetical protein
MFPTLHTSHITLFLGVPVVGVATECDQAAHQSIRYSINRYGEEVAPPQRLEWSSSWCICVLIFIIFYMFVVFGVMLLKKFKKTDLRMRDASLLTSCAITQAKRRIIGSF